MRKIDMENLGNIDLESLIENISEENIENISDENASIDENIQEISDDYQEEETDTELDEDIIENTKETDKIKSNINDTLEDIEENEEDENLYDSNTIKVILQDYKELKEKYDELNDKYVRTMADFGNFRKRNFEENKTKIEKSKVTLLKEIIALNDNFDKALKEAEENQSFENLLEGVQAIQKMVLYTLERENVTPIDTTDEKFNPELHDCIAVVPVPGVSAETIIDETQKGYILGKTVIRPSKVVVAAGSDEVSDTPVEDEAPEEQNQKTNTDSEEAVEIPVNVIEE